MIGAGSREPEARHRRTTRAIAPATGNNTVGQNHAGRLGRRRSPAIAGAETFEPMWPPCAATLGLEAGECRLDCSARQPLRSTVFRAMPVRGAVPRCSARVRTGDSRTREETAPRADVTLAARSAPSSGSARRPESRGRALFRLFVPLDATEAAATLVPGEDTAAAEAGWAEAAGTAGAEAAGTAGAEAADGDGGGGGGAAGAGAGELGAAGVAGCAGRNRSGST
jgi:hypothetical protein